MQPIVRLGDIANGIGGFVMNGELIDDASGISVSGGGDINGDGLSDLLIGAAGADPGGLSNAGRSYVVFGKANTTAVELSSIAAGSGGFALNGEQANSLSGTSVSMVGDVNNDGRSDLLIGASWTNLLRDPRAGRSYLVFGPSSTTAISAINLSSVGGTTGFRIDGSYGGTLGTAVAQAGDVNGDGLEDIVIGAPLFLPPNGSGAGASYVIYGKTDGTAIETLYGIPAGFVLYGENPGDAAGTSVSGGGDINGDGLDDLIIGSPFADVAGKEQVGRSYVVWGRPGNNAIILSDIANGTGGFVITGEQAGDMSGSSVSIAGDINGDGLDDLLIGAYEADVTVNQTTRSRAGKTYVVFGKSNTTAIDLSAIAAGNGGFVIYGEQVDDRAGSWVSGAGDVNGDGLDDLIVSAPFADPMGRSAAGRSYVIFGKTTGTAVNLATIATGVGGFAIEGEGIDDRAGRSVSKAGDVNGDGLADIIVGAPNADPSGRSNSGRSYVVFGQGFTGTSGTIGDDTLFGTSGANSIIGGQGNDTIMGNGGADVLYGGVGNDVFVINDLLFRRIDGGGNDDTLRLDGSGFTLDLRSSIGRRIRNIERIDLTGSGNNGLILSPLAVQNLSDTSNTLIVDGNAGDSVQATGFSRDGTFNNFHRYVSGNVVLLLSPALTFDSSDVAELSFSSSSFSIREDGSASNITVTRSGRMSDTVSARISLSTGNGDTATSGLDYTTPFDFTFGPGETSKTISLSSVITNDILPEDNEVLTLTLTGGTGTTVRTSTSKLTIVDNDVVLNFGSTNFRIREDRTVITSVVVTRQGGLNDTVSGSISLSSLTGNTATQGSDYSSTPILFTLNPNETSKVIPVETAIALDTLPESDETLTLTLSGSNGVTIGATNTSTLTIVDNDAELSFSGSSFSVREDGTPISTVTVTRRGALSETVSGNISLTTRSGEGDTATSGQDYNTTPIAVTFAPNELSKAVSLNSAIINDTQIESSETLTLTLAGGSGVAVGPTSSAKLTIVDDDAHIGFQSAPASVVEGNGFFNPFVTLTRTGRSSGAITVRVVPVQRPGDAAVLNSDFSPIANPPTVTFGDGDVSNKTIDLRSYLQILNGTEQEATESVGLRIEIVSGNATGGETTLSIEDNDYIGGAGNDSLTGSAYNDYIVGNGGDDTLIGSPIDKTFPGRGEIDVLIGGAGRDSFVLGRATQYFYDDGDNFSAGLNDYALIQDFSIVQNDVIQLRGPRTLYRLAPNTTVGSATGLAIYMRNGANGEWWRDELVGLLQGFSGTLDLASSSFRYV